MNLIMQAASLGNFETVIGLKVQSNISSESEQTVCMFPFLLVKKPYNYLVLANR